MPLGSQNGWHLVSLDTPALPQVAGRKEGARWYSQPLRICTKLGHGIGGGEEFLLAAEYVLKQGNTRVMLCERGIRTFEDHTRFTLPLATVPYLHQTTHLPVVVDPSHGTGKASLVATMARAAVAAGADGLIVEVHPDPENALSDGFQALTPTAFRQMMTECRHIAEAIGREL